MKLLPPPTINERHYRVRELADLWHASTDFVRDLFVDEEGVLVIYRKKRGIREWKFMLIPESVVIRVYNKYRQALDEAISVRMARTRQPENQ